MPTLEEQIQEMIATGNFSPEQGEEMRQYANTRLAQGKPSAGAEAGGIKDVFRGIGYGVSELAGALPSLPPQPQVAQGLGFKSGIAGALGRSNFSQEQKDAATTAQIDAKAQLRTHNVMKKRRLQEEMTSEPQPGLSYEEQTAHDRAQVRLEMEDRLKAKEGESAAAGMSTWDVIAGKAPPKVGGEFVFPPGDMTQSVRYQQAKAEADAATEGQAVAEIPDDVQLGGTNPKDTPPVSVSKERKYANIEKPGDVRRASAQRKLDQLSNLRSIAEGGMRIGNMPVQGDFSGTGPPRPYVTGQPQRAEGIRGEIARISGEEDLYLKSQLRREEQQQLSGLRSEEDRVNAELDRLGIPNNLTTWQADELLKERKEWLGGDTNSKGNEALAAVRAGLESLRDMDGEAPAGQAQVLGARQLLQAYGEGSRMSDQDINQILLSPQFAGMYDRAYRFITGRTTPMTVKLYKKMLTRLGKATREHVVGTRKKRAKSFSDSTGIPVDVVLRSYGTLVGEDEGGGAGGVSGKFVPMVHKETGKKKNVHEDDVPQAETRGWARAGSI